jgi:hypothetical protein
LVSTNSDPVAAIPEADAVGEIADIFADIRATLGVPVGNLIWRHLATIEGALPWAWQSLKPLYERGVIAAEATSLRAGIPVVSCAGLSGPALAAAGLTDGDLGRIEMILQSYDRSNAMNLVALGALMAKLDGADGRQTVPSPSALSVPQSVSSPAVSGEMPALLALDAMPPTVRALVEDLNRIGGRDEILPSMYRHMAHWPAYLALIHVLVARFDGDGQLVPLIEKVAADGYNRGASISTGMARPAAALDPGNEGPVRDALVSFSDGPLAKMTTIVALISSASRSQGQDPRVRTLA